MLKSKGVGWGGGLKNEWRKFSHSSPGCLSFLFSVFIVHFAPSSHQLFSLRACLPPGRARRAPRRSTTEAPRRRTKRRASTTRRWTGGSSCVTRGTWSPPSGQSDSSVQLQGPCSGTGSLLLSKLFHPLLIYIPIYMLLISFHLLRPQAYLLDRTQD